MNPFVRSLQLDDFFIRLGQFKTTVIGTWVLRLHGRDVGMIQCRERSRLTSEARQTFTVRRKRLSPDSSDLAQT